MSLKDIVYIGLRHVDPFEKLILKNYQINAFGMEVYTIENKWKLINKNIYIFKEVDRHGIVNIVDMALHSVDPKGERGIHVSFDIDALDALEVPSTGTPG